MQARTKLEKEVVRLSKILHPLTDVQKKWAVEKCFEHIAFSTGASRWCSDCGHVWKDRETIDKTICPVCGKKLSIIPSKDRHAAFSDYYFTVITTLCDYQIVSIYSLNKESLKREKAKYSFDNIIQIWYNKSGKETILAKNMNMGSDSYNRYSELSVKKPHYNGYGLSDYKSFYGKIYPKMYFTKELKKRGLSNTLFECNPCYLFRGLLSNEPFYENLLKTGQVKLLKYIISYPGKIDVQLKKAVNICNRKHYLIDDANLWMDYFSMLEYLNMDTHNPKFICPENLMNNHDILLKRKKKKQDKEERIRVLQENIKDIKSHKEYVTDFYKHIDKFADLSLQTNDFKIIPLENITQFYLEAKYMHNATFPTNTLRKMIHLFFRQETKTEKDWKQ